MASGRRGRLLLTGVAIALIVAGAGVVGFFVVGDGGSDEPETDATNRAMAAMIVDHIPREHTSKGDLDELEHGNEYPRGSIGATVNFDADVLGVHGLATPGHREFDKYACDSRRVEVYDGCREEKLDNGWTLRTSWQKVMPEEDPGSVTLSVRRDDQVTSIWISGPEITGDPAKTDDLPDGLDTYVDLVTHPAFGLRTSQRYVDEGADFESWGGGGLG